MDINNSTVPASTSSFEAVLTMPSTEQLGQLANAESGMSLTVAYRKSEDWLLLTDVPIRCFYLGTKEIPNEDGEMVLCAAFMNPDGVFLAGQMVLVEAVRRLNQGVALEITYKGKKKNKSSKGDTNIFEVRTLKLLGNA